MKKISALFLAIVAALICFSCVDNARTGSYVENSLEYSCYWMSSFNEISAIYSFNVELPDTTKYEVSYNVVLYYNSREISSKQETTTATPYGERVVEISGVWDVPYSGSIANENGLMIEVDDVRVTPYKSDNNYSGFAIGYGVAGGLLLIVATVLFVRSKNTRNNE